MGKLIKSISLILFLLSIAAAANADITSTSTPFTWTQVTVPKEKPPQTEELIEAGRKVYFKRCWFCHGEKGDGNGPVADYLDPRPRDFTLGMFKLRTTATGELPTDEDLFRTITRGIPGTGMPEWGPFLSEAERWQVIAFIKTFAPEFSNPDFDPYKRIVVDLSKEPPVKPTSESIEKGKKVFERSKCWECHGLEGRGNGQKSADLVDGWGFPLRIRNLTQNWKVKRGTTPKDIFTTFSTGLDGTPMPSFTDSLNEEERWNLANFVAATIVEEHPFDKVVIEAKKVEEEIPLDPEASMWNNLPVLEVPLAGQILARPRWHNPAVEMVRLRAVYNAKELGFLLEWDDPFKDEVHNEEEETAQDNFSDTYMQAFDVVPRRPGHFRDSIALQFPIKIAEGAEKPHFFRGDPGKPVNLWLWKSDLEAKGVSPVEEFTAKSFKKPLSPHSPESQLVNAKGVWKDGQWKVVMKRSLTTEDRNDSQFEVGRLIPVAIEAWDGANGEHGLLMSLSTWHYVYLKPPVPSSLYVYALLSMVVVGLLEVWLIRRSRS